MRCTKKVGRVNTYRILYNKLTYNNLYISSRFSAAFLPFLVLPEELREREPSELEQYVLLVEVPHRLVYHLSGFVRRHPVEPAEASLEVAEVALDDGVVVATAPTGSRTPCRHKRKPPLSSASSERQDSLRCSAPTGGSACCGSYPTPAAGAPEDTPSAGRSPTSPPPPRPEIRQAHQPPLQLQLFLGTCSRSGDTRSPHASDQSCDLCPTPPVGTHSKCSPFSSLFLSLSNFFLLQIIIA